MAEWTTEPLDQCLEALIDYRGKSPTKSPTGIPVLSAKVVKTTGLLRPIEQTIAPDYYQQWMRRGFPRPGDVVMTTEAPMGEVIQLDDETSKFALGQRIVCLRGIPGKLDNTFLRYLLTSPLQQEILASYATGTTVLGISQKALRSVPISYPALDEQVAISGLLSALDDKIELNRRMNETLEAQARVLFRDWFVDFGPVKAKMAGDTPYLAPDLWSIFPDRLNDDGMPEGWERCQVRDVLSLSYGNSLPARNRQPGSVPVYGSGGISGYHNSALIDGPTIILGRKGTVGSLFWEAAPSFPIDTVFYVVPKVSLEYCYQLLASFPLGDMNTDAAVPGLNRDNVYRLEFARPSDRLLVAFDEHASALRRKIAANELQNQTLAQTRDLLLPKLMSGELRVRRAERQIEEAL